MPSPPIVRESQRSATTVASAPIASAAGRAAAAGIRSYCAVAAVSERKSPAIPRANEGQRGLRPLAALADHDAVREQRPRSRKGEHDSSRHVEPAPVDGESDEEREADEDGGASHQREESATQELLQVDGLRGRTRRPRAKA